MAERHRRGIAPFRPKRPDIAWTPEMIAMLGTDSDREVGCILGISLSSVFRKRSELGIPAYRRMYWRVPRGHHWTSDELAMLGKLSDGEVAKCVGLSTTSVHRKRRLLGIPPSQPPAARVDWNEERIALLGTASDVEIAERIGVSVSTLHKQRQSLDILPPTDCRAIARTPELVAALRLPNARAHRRAVTGSNSNTFAGEIARACGLQRPKGGWARGWDSDRAKPKKGRKPILSPCALP